MFHIDYKHPTPLYHQLERSIKFAIATGKLRIGEQLPTVRQLAVDLKINANTVAKVYAELERLGVLETRRGVGTFVQEPPAEAAFNRRDSTRLVAGAIAEDRAAMGEGRRAATRQVYRIARAGPFLDHSVR